MFLWVFGLFLLRSLMVVRALSVSDGRLILPAEAQNTMLGIIEHGVLNVLAPVCIHRFLLILSVVISSLVPRSARSCFSSEADIVRPTFLRSMKEAGTTVKSKKSIERRFVQELMVIHPSNMSADLRGNLSSPSELQQEPFDIKNIA
ncbi:hypothetical protein AXG93_242s1500 [Marchantia polymorpha subsp. ruderalis]|uniref:Uncharacterized protein n=1 Tax=Marchantia polymorpha subsp. ruderalis TaxID=1480154 RepID=A0A176VPS6_MARPO|nr:hypothetical protein AXG93_242s1500 [Marchantia polymorpha subsp. ruderalis]